MLYTSKVFHGGICTCYRTPIEIYVGCVTWRYRYKKRASFLHTGKFIYKLSLLAETYR